MVKFYQFHGTKQEIAAIKAVLGKSPADHSVYMRPIYEHMQVCLGPETVYEYSLKRSVLNPNLVAAIKRVAEQYPHLLWVIAGKDLNTPVVYRGERLSNYDQEENGKKGFPGPFGALCLKYGVSYYGKATVESQQIGEQAPAEVVEYGSDRDMAEIEIAKNGYSGFYDGVIWMCVSHTIDHLGGEWQALLAFARGETTELPGDLIEAWHEGSVQNLLSSKDLPKGIHCEATDEEDEECGTEIYPADESWDEEDNTNE